MASIPSFHVKGETHNLTRKIPEDGMGMKTDEATNVSAVEKQEKCQEGHCPKGINIFNKVSLVLRLSIAVSHMYGTTVQIDFF